MSRIIVVGPADEKRMGEKGEGGRMKDEG